MYRNLILFMLPVALMATKYAGEFQELQVGARSCAMGGTGIAQFSDAAALYFNPAGTFFTQRSIHLMHAENFAGIVKNDFGAVVLPRENMSIGVGLQYVHADDIKLTTLSDSTEPPGSNNVPVVYDTVSTSDVLFYINGSRGNQRLAYGANLKVFYRNLNAISGFGGGLDLGLALRLNYLHVGLAVRDFILSPLIWSSGRTETILPKIALGVAPVLPIRAINSILILETDIIKVIDVAGFDVNLGLEYGYKDLVFGRLGVYGGNYTLGIGLQYKKFAFDYAFMTHPDLDNTNKFSAGYRF